MEADGNAGEVIVADLMSDTVRWRNVLTDMIEEGEDKFTLAATKAATESNNQRFRRGNGAAI